jgi:hypothetical protein
MPEVFFFPDLLYQRVEYYVEAPKYYITKVEYYTRAIMGKFYFFFHGNVNQLYSFSNCQYASYLLLHINVQIMLSSNLWLHAAVRVVTLMSGSITNVPISLGYGGYQQQHTQQPVTTLRPPSATPPRLEGIIPQFMLPRATT